MGSIDHILAEVSRTPWALEQTYMASMLQLLMRRHRGEPATASDLAAFRDERSARASAPRYAGNGAIAVINVFGVITQRGNMIDELCGPGSCSAEVLTGQLRAAEADDSIGQILLNFASPGGSVFGIQETAAEINRIRGVKPVLGIANSTSASAAYWLMSACTECYCTPSGEVGSIGVWQAHQDISKALEGEGVAVTLISAGKYKTEGNPYGPLDASARSFMQQRTDDYYGAFTRAVAKGRGVSVETVRKGMGQGRMLGADGALRERMIDGIATFDQVVGKMRQAAAGGRSALPVTYPAVRNHGALAAAAAARNREIDLLELS